jgi:hypothetical protein
VELILRHAGDRSQQGPRHPILRDAPLDKLPLSASLAVTG